jgi:hypothetical protein
MHSSNSVYRLLCFRDPMDTNPHAWYNIREPNMVTIQIGKHFGMIVEKYVCDCNSQQHIVSGLFFYYNF